MSRLWRVAGGIAFALLALSSCGGDSGRILEDQSPWAARRLAPDMLQVVYTVPDGDRLDDVKLIRVEDGELAVVVTTEVPDPAEVNQLVGYWKCLVLVLNRPERIRVATRPGEEVQPPPVGAFDAASCPRRQVEVPE